MMSGQREPPENISGEDGEYLDGTPRDGPRSRPEAVVDRLGTMYWRKSYGGQDAFTCLVRTVLSQNTSDVASKPAFDALLERFGENGLAQALRDAPTDAIAEVIEPAGLYNQKADVLQSAADRVIDEFDGQEGFNDAITERPPEEARDVLLSFDGVGPKTADCVLLFAGGRAGVFPVDTHVHRIARRLGLAPPDADHEDVRAALESPLPSDRREGGPAAIDGPDDGDPDPAEHGFTNGGTYLVDGKEITFAPGGVPPEKCGFGHTAMIQFGREYCTARNPACLDGPEACPLVDLCDRVGVDIESDTVVDPSETVQDG